MTGYSAPDEEQIGGDDLRLMLRARVDPAAFAGIYDRYVDVVYAYCRRRLRTVELAEDACSTAFLKAIAAIPHYRTERGSVRAWLFTIVHNVVVDLIRADARHPHLQLEEAFGVADAGISPEDALLASEVKRDLSSAVSWLTDEQRTVIELRLAGLSGQEIALVLHISHSAVRSLQRRAIVRMRGSFCLASKDERS